jgi:hypothetical protein
MPHGGGIGPSSGIECEGRAAVAGGAADEGAGIRLRRGWDEEDEEQGGE